MKKIIFLFASLLAFSAANAQTNPNGNSNAQTVSLEIPSVALIKVSGGNQTFRFADVTAGNNFIDATSTGATLQYTSILTSSTERAIYVSAAATPVSTKGFNLSVTATTGTITNGNGQRGTPVATPAYIYISSQTAPLVTYSGTNTFASANVGTFNTKLIEGIASCYTGSAAGDGPALTYKASVGTAGGMPAIDPANYALLRAGTYAFSVYYTLADNV